MRTAAPPNRCVGRGYGVQTEGLGWVEFDRKIKVLGSRIGRSQLLGDWDGKSQVLEEGNWGSQFPPNHSGGQKRGVVEYQVESGL